MLSVVLAFFFGYLLTFSSVRRARCLAAAKAVRLALASDTVSITTMEIVDNLFILVVPGAMAAGLADRAVLVEPGGVAGDRLRA